ncbi:MAG: GGDEF domain-containing protein [Lachnospiraceae bacterium]|nr:GGDEF domain-containing protein [Lachnospiraceae bacterium]
MGFDYFVFYTEASFICILILAMILINDKLHGTLQEKQLWFRRAVILFILYFISDACWAAMLSGMFVRIRFFAVLFNLTNYILLNMMGYGTFMFITVSEKMPFTKSKRSICLCLLPVIIATLVMVSAYISDPLFWINENLELNNLYYPMMILPSSLYLISGFVHSVLNARRSEIKEVKVQYLLLGSIPIGVMAFGMIQVFALNAPTFCFGCTIMWLWFYIQNMQTMISVDDLTRLNNRRQINRYMDQFSYSQDTRIIIMMIDIDRFKKINDTYGHAEGDRALVMVSDALRQTCEKINSSAFLGRYGGDEFIIIIRNPKEGEQPEIISEAIRRTISQKQEDCQLPYDLEISIGYDELKSKDDTLHSCMIRADDKLYVDKHRSHYNI